MDEKAELPACRRCGAQMTECPRWWWPWPPEGLDDRTMLLHCLECGQLAVLDTEHGHTWWCLDEL